MRKAQRLNRYALLLMIVGIALNLCLSRLVLLLKLPLFIDSAGTILAGALGGFLPGMIVGFFTNYRNSINDPITLYYSVLSIIIGILADAFSRPGFFKKPLKALISVPAFAAVGGALGSVMTWALYGLNIGEGISAPFALFFVNHTSFTKFWSQFSADCIIDVADKLITVLSVVCIIRLLPDKFLNRLPLGDAYVSSKSETAAVTPDIPTVGKKRFIFPLSIKLPH